MRVFGLQPETESPDWQQPSSVSHRLEEVAGVSETKFVSTYGSSENDGMRESRSYWWHQVNFDAEMSQEAGRRPVLYSCCQFAVDCYLFSIGDVRGASGLT